MQTFNMCAKTVILFLHSLGRDLPDTDVSWNLDRELALSANTGLSAIESGVRKAGSVRRTFRGDFPQHAGEVPQPS
jgi:hypothetical protein